jgi:hypothetical protein
LSPRCGTDLCDGPAEAATKLPGGCDRIRRIERFNGGIDPWARLKTSATTPISMASFWARRVFRSTVQGFPRDGWRHTLPERLGVPQYRCPRTARLCHDIGEAGRMTESDLHYRSLIDIAADLRNRRLSSVEVTTAILSRIEKLDAGLKSYTTVTGDLALAQAAQADQEIGEGKYRSPLHGVPIAPWCRDGRPQPDASGRHRAFCAGGRSTRDSFPRPRTALQALGRSGLYRVGICSRPDFCGA